MSDEDEELYLAIIEGRAQPDPALLQAGIDAHAAGMGFGEGPRPFHAIPALCWRIGWNQRAREQRD